MAKLNERKLSWAFGLSLFILAINAIVSYHDLIEQTRNTFDVVRSREVLEITADIESTIKDAETARRGFLIDQNEADRGAVHEAAERVEASLLRWNRLARVHPSRQERVDAVQQKLQPFLVELRHSIDQLARLEPDSARSRFGSEPVRQQIAAVQNELEGVETAETNHLAEQVEERRVRISRAFITFSVASTLALLTIGSTYLVVRRYLGDQVRADRTHRENEARIRLLFDSVGEGIYGIDTQGRCTFCNPAALRLLGFTTVDQVLSRDMHQLIHHTRPDGSPFPAHLCPIYQTIHSGEGVLGIEDFFFRADGNPFPVEYRAHAIRRGEELLGAVVTFVDIARKRRSENEMRQRDRALEAIGQGVFISDLNGIGNPIIYANASFERLTGYGPEDWRGKSLSELQSDEFVGLSGEYTLMPDAALELSAEMRARRKDGSSYWQALTIAPVADPLARSNHLVGVITDVSERRDSEQKLRRSEERLRLMVESVHDYAIYSIDLRGRIASWNSGAERLFGFSDAVIVGEPTDRLFQDEDRLARLPSHELQQAKLSGRFEDERWHVRSDKTRFLASSLTTAVRDEAGVLVGFTTVARDITESKRAETELRAAKETAESAVRAKSTFLANMGHELRTPLNAIIGYSEMLTEEATDLGHPDFVADLDRIREAGHLLLKMINNLLDLSKIEAGRMELIDEPFDVADLVRSVVRAAEPLAEKQGNTIQVVYPSDLGTLNSDFAKISQALNHLMNNAIKFTESGIIHFRVARERDDNDREWIAFCISDDGIGMTRDQVGGLFQPFIQADPSAARRYGGTGLGLTITHRFCQLMGGKIEVNSDPGQGSTFTMRLPATKNSLSINQDH